MRHSSLQDDRKEPADEAISEAAVESVPCAPDRDGEEYLQAAANWDEEDALSVLAVAGCMEYDDKRRGAHA